MKVTNAAGVTGMLIRAIDGTYFFRVYAGEDGRLKFTDYELVHSDLTVTIDETEECAFYEDGDKRWLDHAPATLGK